MSATPIEVADLCHALAENATVAQRRTLLDLAGRWLRKAPDEPSKHKLLGELAAMQKPLC
jgi:hypothetical protein